MIGFKYDWSAPASRTCLEIVSSLNKSSFKILRPSPSCGPDEFEEIGCLVGTASPNGKASLEPWGGAGTVVKMPYIVTGIATFNDSAEEKYVKANDILKGGGTCECPLMLVSCFSTDRGDCWTSVQAINHTYS